MTSLFDDGINGIMVEPTDTQALQGGILELLGNGEKRRQLGLAARAKAVKEYSIDRAVDDVESILRKLSEDKWQ